MNTNDGRVASDQALAVPATPASGRDASRFDPSREFAAKICRAAHRVAVQEMFRGPIEHGHSWQEHCDNVNLKRRVDDEALGALIEVVLFAKVHGSAIVALRDSDGNPKGGNEVPSRSDDSAGLQASPEQGQPHA